MAKAIDCAALLPSLSRRGGHPGPGCPGGVSRRDADVDQGPAPGDLPHFRLEAGTGECHTDFPVSETDATPRPATCRGRVSTARGQVRIAGTAPLSPVRSRHCDQARTRPERCRVNGATAHHPRPASPRPRHGAERERIPVTPALATCGPQGRMGFRAGAGEAPARRDRAGCGTDPWTGRAAVPVMT